MNSSQSVVSPFKGSSFITNSEKQKIDHWAKSPGCLSTGIEVHTKQATICNLEDSLGVLDVYVSQARDIHNICIYHKQDVYAKLCLTSYPKDTISTQIINGGGKNPVFNENLSLNVRTIDSSLKCEIWMLSRVRNYLEDQLLGFALVPLSEVIIKNGKLEKEFCLSSTDLFHSPAGFVQLSLSYSGPSPDVIAIPMLPSSVASDEALNGAVPHSLPCEIDKIEFPDPKTVTENEMMVSEYFGMSCVNLQSQSSESLVSSDSDDHLSAEVCLNVAESFSSGTVDSSSPPEHVSSLNRISTGGFPSISLTVSSQSSETLRPSKSPSEAYVSPPKEKTEEKRVDGDAESNVSVGLSDNTLIKPVVTVNIKQEEKVVQQEIIDMYMKSMQQFTESLAMMKLPLDMETGPTSSGNSSSNEKLQTSKASGSRVFYGSRAFF